MKKILIILLSCLMVLSISSIVLADRCYQKDGRLKPNAPPSCIGTTTTTTTTTIPSIEDIYNQYFDNNPKVKAYIQQLNMDYFWQYINEVENTGSITVPEPAQLAACTDSCLTICLTDDETDQIYAAKVAHAIWLDKNNIFPWKLSDYSSEELNYLLDKAHLFGTSHCISYIIDYSPSDIYGYMQQHIKPTPEETLYSFIEDIRTDFRHGTSADPDNWYYISHPTIETLTYYYNNKRISPRGCITMARIAVYSLDSLNIPGYWSTQYYYGGGHHSALWPNIGKILNHGDDIYNGLLVDTPTSELLMPWSYFETNVLSCGTDSACKKYWTVRYNVLNQIAYTTQNSKNICCEAEAGGSDNFVDCDDYLCNAVSTRGAQWCPYLTQEEYDNAKTNLLSQCQPPEPPW